MKSTRAQLLAWISLAWQHLPKIELGNRILCLHWLPLALQLCSSGTREKPWENPELSHQTAGTCSVMAPGKPALLLSSQASWKQHHTACESHKCETSPSLITANEMLSCCPSKVTALTLIQDTAMFCLLQQELQGLNLSQENSHVLTQI